MGTHIGVMPAPAQWLLLAATASVFRIASASPLPNPNPLPSPNPNPAPAPFLPPFNLLTQLLGFGQSSGTLDGSLDAPHKSKKCKCRRSSTVGFYEDEEEDEEVDDAFSSRTFHHHKRPKKKKKKPCSCYGAPTSSYGAPHSSYGAPSYKKPKKHKKKKKCKPSYHGRKRRSPDHGPSSSSDDFNFGSDGLFDDGGFGGFGGGGFSSGFDSEFHTHGHKTKKPKKRKCH